MVVRPTRLLTGRHARLQATWAGKQQSEKQQQDNVRGLLADLKSCSTARDLEWGRRIHATVLEIGEGSNVHVATALVNMYAKCGSMADAHQVFGSIRHPDVVSWNTLLLGYADNGEGVTTLDLFSRMKYWGCGEPNSKSYMAALKACASLTTKRDGSGRAECLERTKQLHLQIGRHLDLHVQSCLIDTYAKCCSMVDAHQVFDSIKYPDVVSWNTLLLGYADNGEGRIALDLFSRMKSQGCTPNSTSYLAALKACASLALKQSGAAKAKCLELGKQLQREVGSHWSLSLQNTMVDMFAKCGSMGDAQQVFDSIKHPSVVSWNVLILGYADGGEGQVALNLFTRIKSQGCTPNSITYMAALKACALLGALDFGQKVHAEIPGHDFDEMSVTCLVDFYAKCGNLVKAQEVFDLHSEARNLKTWTALLAGYSSFGETESVFGLFQRMQDAGFQPDRVTFQCILLCCSHAGLVEKARECFEAMPIKYGVAPSIEHYTCMLDVLGRGNKMLDAMLLLQRMPCNPDAVTWMTLLGACYKWKDAEIGTLAFQCLVSLDEGYAAAYVLMAQIYASRGMWKEQEMVFAMRKGSQSRTGRAETCCWTDEAGQVHRLLPGDTEHPQIEEMRQKLKHIDQVMKEHGSVAGGIDAALCGHSEKLAVACALINTGPGKAITIVKSTNVCDDCHTSLAVVSKLEGRTILLRDARKFHVFKHGKCSGCW